MYILNKPVAWFGIAVAGLSTVFCPFIKAPLVGNWNLYQTDLSLFFITIGLLALIILLFFIRQVRVYRILTRMFFCWCVLAFSAVYFKMNNYFGMKLFDGMLAKTLHIKWGWFFLFLGAVILLISVRKAKELK